LYRGLLQRRRITIASLHYIGKESNQLEDVQFGTVHDLDEVYTVYVAPDRGLLDALRSMTNRELQDRTGLARSTLQRIRNQGVVPRRSNRSRLAQLL
jgi:hypothetical protein